jgi:SAM-dependent methyltransferase
MKVDIRSEAAAYYDLNPHIPDDIPFYLSRIPSPDAAVLELGCGTGRVTLPLAGHCRYVHGIDLSPAMIAVCQQKLEETRIPPTRAGVEVGDITRFDLGQTFDLIIAPFRVLQNLESDADVEGLLRCVRRHLAPGATCILTAFNPNRDRETLRREWCSDEQRLSWEVPIPGGRVACYDTSPRLEPEKLILYPELIYRRYEGDLLKQEVVLKLVMRCYYPEELVELVTAHGFEVVGRWGGYAGEPYGEGPELVVEFAEGR